MPALALAEASPGGGHGWGSVGSLDQASQWLAKSVFYAGRSWGCRDEEGAGGRGVRGDSGGCCGG